MIFSARQLKIRKEEQNVFSMQDCEIGCLKKKNTQLTKLQKYSGNGKILREQVKNSCRWTVLVIVVLFIHSGTNWT